MILWLLAEAAQAGNFIPHETSIAERGVSLVGVVALVGLAWVLSTNRKAIDWRPVVWGVGLQLFFGVLVLSPVGGLVWDAVLGMATAMGFEPSAELRSNGFFFTVVNGGVNKLLEFAGDGASFVFQSVQPHMVFVPPAGSENPVGDLFGGQGAHQVFVGTELGGISPPMKTFATWILPTIIFFSALMSVLYHLGVMQVVVKVIARLMVRTLGTSGAESLSAAGNIFVGQTEAPLLIRPFVDKMTKSELMAVMTGGFATVAGGVLGAYVAFLRDIPNIAGHLVVASILSAPAALAIAKVMLPETEVPMTRGEVTMPEDKPCSNFIEAAGRGATDGMTLALNVAAMLIAIVALVSAFDWAVSWVPVTFCSYSQEMADGTRLSHSWTNTGYSCGVGDWSEANQGLTKASPLALATMLGWLFAPIALVMGVPYNECLVVGRLLGEKIVLTEFIAYINLGMLINSPEAVLSERGAIISSYALCGFANFASIGIQLGGIGGIAPNRMGDLAEIGFRAMVGGVIAACMTGAVAGVFL